MFSKEIAAIDLKLNKLQQEIHGIGSNSDSEEVEIGSLFFPNQENKCPYSIVYKKIPSIKNDKSSIFTVDNDLDLIIRTYLYYQLPAIRVKEKVRDVIRICWSHNLFHNIINSASFMKDRIQLTSFDTVTLDIYKKFYLRNGFGKKYNEGIGNVPELENWNTFLPSYKLVAQQFWPFSEDTTLSFPLFLLPNSTITFEYSFNLKLDKLLRMQMKNKNDEWIDIECTTRYIESNVDLRKKETPKMIGIYAILSEEEKNHWAQEKQHNYYYNHMIPIDTKNTTTYDRKENISFNINNPCKAIHWVVEDQEKIKFSNRSNYTTSNEVYKGNYPWNNPCLNYNTTPRFESIPYQIIDIIEPYYLTKNTSDEKGYGIFSFCLDPFSKDNNMTVILSTCQTVLELDIENTGQESDFIPFDVDDDDDSDKELKQREKMMNNTNITDKKLLVKTRLLTIRKISIIKDIQDESTYDKLSENEKIAIKYKINIIDA